MNPSKTEPAAPQPSPASSTYSEFEYLLQPVSSSSEEEEESEEEDNSQHSGDSSQSSTSSTPSKDNIEEREAPPQPASITPMDLDTVSKEPQRGCDDESSISNTPSYDDIEEMLLSPQPTSTPLTDLDTVCEEPEGQSGDELDGAMFKLFSDIVKCLVTRVLYAAIWDHNEYLCYGCKISHPSQKQHTCLFGIPGNFLSTHYDGLKKRVLTDRFLVAASQLLDKCSIRVSEEKIRGAAENILLELRDSENLEKVLIEAVASWVGDSVLKIVYLQEAEKLWAGVEE